jgi:BolA protein
MVDVHSGMRIDRIRQRLEQQFAPAALEVIDESHRHAGHPGARSGKGHFRVRIVASAFAGLPALRRHQLVYESLDELMTQDIHALSIEALAPGETLESKT